MRLAPAEPAAYDRMLPPSVRRSWSLGRERAKAEHPVDLLFCNDYMPDLSGGIQAALPDHRVRTCPEAEVAEYAGDAAVLLPARAIIDATVLDASPKLRLVQQPGVGLDAIDVAAANARGVRVANVPSADGGLAQAVAEMALFLLIGGGRRYPRLLEGVRTQDWNVPFGHSLFGSRVCVIGLGGIGSQLVRLLQPFGCEIVGVRRTPPRERTCTSLD